MEIYAFDAAREIVKVDLPPAVVVENEIDPARVDLFESNPRALTLDGRQLFFTPMGDLSFGRVKNGRTIIGIHDGLTNVCFSGTPTLDGSVHSYFRLPVQDLQIDHLDSHLIEYLSVWDAQMSRSADAVSPIQALPFFDMDHEIEVSIKDGFVAYKARKALLFGAYCLCAPEFFGHMLEEVSLPQRMPDTIAWVFETFRQWQPIVIGSCLRDTIWRQPIHQVHVYVNAPDPTAIKIHLTHFSPLVSTDVVPFASDPAAMYSHGGTTALTQAAIAATAMDYPTGDWTHLLYRGVVYSFRDVKSYSRTERQNLTHWRQYPAADLLRSERLGTIIAKRIALHDLGRNRLRKLGDLGKEPGNTN